MCKYELINIGSMEYNFAEMISFRPRSHKAIPVTRTPDKRNNADGKGQR